MEIGTERIYRVLGNFANTGETQTDWYLVQNYKDFLIVKQPDSVYVATNTHKDNKSKWSLYDKCSLLIFPHNIDVISISNNLSEDVIKEELLRLTDEIEELESSTYYFNS